MTTVPNIKKLRLPPCSKSDILQKLWVRWQLTCGNVPKVFFLQWALKNAIIFQMMSPA